MQVRSLTFTMPHQLRPIKLPQPIMQPIMQRLVSVNLTIMSNITSSFTITIIIINQLQLIRQAIIQRPIMPTIITLSLMQTRLMQLQLMQQQVRFSLTPTMSQPSSTATQTRHQLTANQQRQHHRSTLITNLKKNPTSHQSQHTH